MYTSLGYCDVVLEATEASMGMAVHEVKETPHYQESGEVYTTHGYEYIVSGLLRMQGTIPQPTPTIQQYPAYQEGLSWICE